MNGAECTLTQFEIDGRMYDRIRFAVESDPNIRACNDCGTIYGNLHHPHCDQELCPMCHEQAIACGHVFGPIPGTRIRRVAFLRKQPAAATGR